MRMLRREVALATGGRREAELPLLLYASIKARAAPKRMASHLPLFEVAAAWSIDAAAGQNPMRSRLRLHRVLLVRIVPDVKRFTRYLQDPQFRAAVDREKARAKIESGQTGWITYAIHDPTTPDHIGDFNTLIVMSANRRTSQRASTEGSERQVRQHGVQRAM